LQSVSYIAGALGVCVAAFYYVMNLRITQKNQELSLAAQQQNLETRQAQLFMSVYQASYSNEVLDNLNKVFKMNYKTIEDYNKMINDPELYRAFYNIAGRYEGIGVLVKEGLVDVRIVSLLESGMIQWWWDRFGSFVLACRKEMGFPRYMVETEYLAKKVAEYKQTHPDLGIATPNVNP
jgi:hypothetical protein